MSQTKRIQVFKFLTLGLLFFLKPAIAQENSRIISVKALPKAGWRSAGLVRSSQAAAGISADLPMPSCGVSAYQMLYRSQTESGAQQTTSALIQVPKCVNKSSFPVLIYNHSTRVQRSDAPSTQIYDPEAWGTAMLFASYGFLVALPDYRGLGLSQDDQHYLSRTTGREDVYSLVQALTEFGAAHQIDFTEDLFIGGYSQGAHVTLAALQKLEESPVNPFHLRGAAAMSGVYGLDSVALDLVIKKGNSAHSVFVIMAVLTQVRLHPEALPAADEILKKELVPVAEDLLAGRIAFKEAMKKLPAKTSDIFTEKYLERISSEKADNELVKVLAAESVDRSYLKTPTLIYAARTDETANAEGARVLAQRLRKLKSPVTLVINETPIDHINASLPAFLRARQYFSELSPQALEILGTTFAPLK